VGEDPALVISFFILGVSSMRSRKNTTPSKSTRIERTSRKQILLESLESRTLFNALVFGSQPTTGTAGVDFMYTVSVTDGHGNVLINDNSSVTLSIKTGPVGASFFGTLTVQAVNGVATFSDTWLDKTGNYTLKATDGLLTANAKTLKIAADPRSRLVLLQQPSSSVVGKAATPGLLIAVEDAFGNIITTDSSTVTLAMTGGPGNVTGTLAVKASHGKAKFNNVKFDTAGGYTFTATDASLALTTMNFGQTIGQGVTTINKPNANAAGYTFGNTINLTANLHATSPSSVPFTGTVNLVRDDNTVLATATLTTGGVAHFSFTAPDPGTYNCTVQYAGDTNHTAATSSTFTFKSLQASTNTALTVSESPAFFGDSLTLTASVTTPTAPGTARTGNVTFMDGTTVLGVVALDGSSQAQFTIATPTLGAHNFKAVYAGDAHFKTSQGTKNVTVGQDTVSAAVTLATLGTITSNETIELDAQITLTNGSNTPTGTVTFKDGATVLGTASISNSGTASLNTALLTGTHHITVSYGGDVNTKPTVSSSLTLVVV